MGRTASYLLALGAGGIASLGVYGLIWPFRLRCMKKNGLCGSKFREAVMALFWMYCGGMAVLTLLPRWVVPAIGNLLTHGIWNAGGAPFFAVGGANLVPFATFGDLYILVGNIVMFLPLGFFPALLFQNYGWRKAFLTGFCVTVFIEVTQLFVGRAFDIDDLMLNTLGVFCGFLLQKALGRGLYCTTAGK